MTARKVVAPSAGVVAEVAAQAIDGPVTDVHALTGTVGGAGGAVVRESGLRRLWQRLREGGALMVGVPDYDRYRAHMRAHHPDLVPLTREAFVQGRMEARYGGKGTGKCPC